MNLENEEEDIIPVEIEGEIRNEEENYDLNANEIELQNEENEIEEQNEENEHEDQIEEQNEYGNLIQDHSEEEVHIEDQNEHENEDQTSSPVNHNDIVILNQKVPMAPIFESQSEHIKSKKPKNAEGLNEEYNQMFEEILKKNSKNLIFKRDNNTSINKSSPLTSHQNPPSSKTNNQLTSDSNQSKIPIELSLYQDASKRKEKKEKSDYNNMMNILLTSSKCKISTNSQKIAITQIEKMLDEIVNSHQSEGKVTFKNIAEILTDLKVFRELLSKKTEENQSDNNNNNKNLKRNNNTYQNYKDIQLEMLNSKQSEIRKQREMAFYEQFWLTINPGNKQYVKVEFVSGILKILFAPMNSNVKEISESVRKFLIIAFLLNSNPEEVKIYISPITNENISEEEIWKIERLVKEFIALKENILAYKEIGHYKKNMQNEIQKKESEMSFKPKINESTKGWNYYSERLPALYEREKLKVEMLKQLKKENENNELKECSFKPNINKTKKKGGDKYKDIKGNNNSSNVYEKLYCTNNVKFKKYEMIKEKETAEKEEKELKECTFQPKLVSQESLKKCLNSKEKPRGFDEFAKKMREGILKATEKKYLENKIPTGENYEKVKRANIQPFSFDKRDSNFFKSKSNVDKSNSKDFFTVQITIPSGKMRSIKVYPTDDPNVVADNFCKTYCFKDDVKERLAKTILNLMNLHKQKTTVKQSTSTINQ